MFTDINTTIAQKLDEAFNVNHFNIDKEIEKAMSRHQKIDKKYLELIHKRVLLLLSLYSTDSKYYNFETFKKAFYNQPSSSLKTDIDTLNFLEELLKDEIMYL